MEVIHFASSHNQKKDNNKFKNKKQPEMPEIWLYGSLTTKELKKNHSSRPVGGVEMGSQDGEDTLPGGSWWSYIYMLINQEEQLRNKTTAQLRVLAQEKKASKPLPVKTCRGCGGRRNSQPHRRVCGRDSQGLEYTQTQLPRNQHQKVPICCG